MKLASWNVNGIRAAAQKGFLKWFENEKADIVCVQEIKANIEQIDEELRHPNGYHSSWFSAQKPGYSGVAIFSKTEPLNMISGMGIDQFDSEGRVQIAEFKNFAVINAYFPNSQREHTRLDYKLEFCEAMLKLCNRYREKGQNIILCGDYNIAHKEIDLKNPKSNQDNAGFLPEERAWMDLFIEKEGFIDTFRHFNKEPNHYTWWSYRPGVREKNVGWRLDYHCTNPEFKDRLKSALIRPEIKGSDHCPVILEIR